MALHPGSLALSPEHVDAIGNTSVDGLRSRYTIAEGDKSSKLQQGLQQFILPGPQREAPQVGSEPRAFGIDWYDTVHVVPHRVSAGNIATTQQYQVLFWSAHRAAIDMAALETVGDAEGVTLEAGPQGPYTWRPLEWTYYQLTVTTQGPVDVDVSYRWPLTGVDDGELAVLGQRLLMLPWSPDWGRGVEETLAWLTDVQRAWDGSENRIQLRDKPRRRLRYRLVLTARAATELEQLLWYWHGKLFGVPIWRDGSALTQIASSGTLTLACETTWREFEGGENAVLWASAESFEVAAVESVAAGELTLERGLVGTWPAGTLVYPLRTGRLPEDVETPRPTADVATTDLDLELDSPSTPAPAGAPDRTWEGQELWLPQPNRARAMGISYALREDRIDGSVGLWESAAREPRPAIIRGHEHAGFSRSEMREYLSFLQRRAGRYAPMWVPTWQIDLRVASATLEQDNELTVVEDQYRTRFDGEPGRDAILLRHKPSKTWLPRRVLSASEDGGGQQTLTLDSALGIAAPPQEWRVYWLETVRLEDDEITIEWRTPTVGTLDLPLRRVDA